MSLESNQSLLDGMNQALRMAGLRTQVVSFVGGHAFGIYETHRLRTGRGGHVLVKLYKQTGTDRVFLKSICRVRDKWRTANLLINGQASTNAQDVRLWADGEGPEILLS